MHGRSRGRCARLAAIALAALVVLLEGMTGGLTGSTAAAQTNGETPSRLRLVVDQMNPRVISADSHMLTISGTITNTGDREITAIEARVQLGTRQSSESQLRQTIARRPPADAEQSDFHNVTRSLRPGQSAHLSLNVALGDGPNAVSVPQRGVYPVLVNVNGTPRYGGPARLAALSMLMPVLGVPGQPQPPRPQRPTGVSMLWPIADTRPRVLDAPYGGQLLLSDDQLARDLRPGGRLDALVAAPQSPGIDQRVSGSLCFAIDPALLDTVQAMSTGYRVRTPNGTAEGTGAEAAKQWLDSLSQLVHGRCVIQLPYADADLNALSHIRADGQPDPTLPPTATSSASVFQRVLQTQPRPGVLWPDGALDGAALDALARAGTETVLTNARQLDAEQQITTATRLTGTQLTAQPIDPLLAEGMNAVRPNPNRYDSSTETSTVSTQPNLATQDGIATLAFRTGLGPDTTSRPTDPVLLAPARRWTASPEELRTLLDTVADFADAGMVAPTQPDELLNQATSGTTSMRSTPEAIATKVPADVTSTLSNVDTQMADFAEALSVDATAQVDPAQLVMPVRKSFLRATSTVWRGQPGAAMASARSSREQFDRLRGRVTVATPPTTISMASGEAPLPVSIASTLPVEVTVHITLTNVTGLRPEPIPDQVIPAGSTVPISIPTEALRTGRFNVDVSLSTPGGTQLGETARFALTSNEYGAITIIVTATAAGALLLLSGRRIYRRIRARRTD